MAQHLAKGPFVVLSSQDKESKYGGTITVITLCNAHGEIVHTYVDPANKNYRLWQDVIDLQDRGCGIVVDNLKYKVQHGETKTRHIKDWHRDEPIINADSRVEIIEVTLDQQEVLDILYEQLAD